MNDEAGSKEELRELVESLHLTIRALKSSYDAVRINYQSQREQIMLLESENTKNAERFERLESEIRELRHQIVLLQPRASDESDQHRID